VKRRRTLTRNRRRRLIHPFGCICWILTDIRAAGMIMIRRRFGRKDGQPRAPVYIICYREWRNADKRISTSAVEGTVNRLIGRRMCKYQHMCWSKRGAHLLLQVFFSRSSSPGAVRSPQRRFTCRLSSLVSNRRGASNHAAVGLATPPIETVPTYTAAGPSALTPSASCKIADRAGSAS
jgi:hypothetical protein